MQYLNVIEKVKESELKKKKISKQERNKEQVLGDEMRNTMEML